MEVSKTDKLACALHAFADSLSQIDDRFADAEGHIKLDSIEKVIEVASLIYSTFKAVYSCLGKSFEIQASGVGGKILNFILDLLENKDKP